MNIRFIKNNEGYIALTSAIVIGLIAIAVSVTLSFTGFFSRANISDSYYKTIADYLSESCVRVALLKMAQNPLYAGNETMSVGSDSCSILPVQTSGLNKIIQTKGVYQKAVANYQVTVVAGLVVLYWEELPTL